MNMDRLPAPEWGKGHGAFRLRPALRIAIALWYGYAAAECLGALAIGSVALAANSIGHFTIGSVHLLLLLAPNPSKRRKLAIATSAILIVPALILPVEVWQRLQAPVAPSASALALLGAGACLIDLIAAGTIASIRPGTMTFASSLKAILWPRAITGPMILLAALATATTGSAWHDLIIGLGIAVAHFGTAGSFLRSNRRI